MSSSWEDRRKALGLSRADAASLSGMKNSSIWAIEMGKLVTNSQSATQAATKQLEKFLEQEELKRDSGWTAPPYPAPPGGTVINEYRGLKLGARFACRTETGLFTFLGLVREARGTEYVAAYGGPPGYGSQRALPIWAVAFPADPLAHDGEDDNDSDRDLMSEADDSVASS